MNNEKHIVDLKEALRKKPHSALARGLICSAECHGRTSLHFQTLQWLRGVTVKPGVTEPTLCVPLERHVIKHDGCIGNNIESGFWNHRSLAHDSLLMRITTISCLPPQGYAPLRAEGRARSDCRGDIDKEHSRLLLKASG